MEITDGFRKARRNTVILCAICLGWSAAQFELTVLSFGSLGVVDLSKASIPLILSFGVLYSMIRCTLEFAMQPVDVRRWELAQIDYWLTMFLFEISLLSLATGSLYRSVETISYVLLAVVILLILSAFLFLTGIFVFMPILVFIRSRQGRYSVVARVQEAEGWSALMVVAAQVTLFVVFAIGSLYYEPLRRLWPTPPSATAVTVFAVLTSIVVISLYTCIFWHSDLFAKKLPYTAKKMPDGTIGISFHEKSTEK